MNLLEFKKSNYQEFYNEVDKIPCSPATDNGDAYWGYVAKPEIDFDVVFEKIALPLNPKVVDLGAGFCENLLRLGYTLETNNLHAVESNTVYADQTQPLLLKHKLPITYYVGDYSRHDISSYDVIYSFCIAKRQPEYDAFNDYVLDNMKVGAYWLEVFAEEATPLDRTTVGTVSKAIARNQGQFDIMYSSDKVLLVRKKA